jgi:hypothetical protein
VTSRACIYIYIYIYIYSSSLFSAILRARILIHLNTMILLNLLLLTINIGLPDVNAYTNRKEVSIVFISDYSLLNTSV